MASGPPPRPSDPSLGARVQGLAGRIARDERGCRGGLLAASYLNELRREPAVAATLFRTAQHGRRGPLAADMIRRIDELGDLPLDSRARRAAFSELLHAFSVPGLRLEMLSQHCVCARSEHAVELAGRLYDGDQLAAAWQRAILLDRRIAVHMYLKVETAFRRRGIAPHMLAGGLALYDTLELEWITLRAALGSGRWHWAACGFDFMPGSSARVTAFFDSLVSALGLGIDTSGFTTATDYALAAPEVTTSMSLVASTLASRIGSAAAFRSVRAVASENGIDFTAQIPAARAIMLCGPEWDGRLWLRGPQRAVFDAYVQSHLERARREDSPFV